MANMLVSVSKATVIDSTNRMLKPKLPATKKIGIIALQGERVSIKMRDVVVAFFG